MTERRATTECGCAPAVPGGGGLGTTLIYLGLGAAALGAWRLLVPSRRVSRQRRRGITPPRPRGSELLAVGASLATAAAGALLPAPTYRLGGGQALSGDLTDSPPVAAPSLLDGLLPAWQFAERHALHVAAPAEQVWSALHLVTAGEIRLFELLTLIRNPARSWRPQAAGILAPDPTRPILEMALASGFTPLAEEPGRELVVGTLVLAPGAGPLPRRVAGAEAFAALDAPGNVKAAMSFRLDAASAGTTELVTETRVFATDASSRRRFAAYWRLIYPGSALIRRMWLRAIASRARRQSAAVSADA